ncbi:MAG: acylase [Chitinophagaceae bacterium]|nr:acylase [Chitinophagaceae bacterium]
MFRISLFAFLVYFSSLLPVQGQTGSTQISWDEWGVPHIYAQTDEELFYLEGWAQMELHANLIVELYGRSRGRASEYWGKEKVDNDIMVHTLGFPELARDWTAKQDPAYKKLLSAFVRGLNDYVKAHPESVKPENRAILPLDEVDVNQHLCFVVFARFVGGEDLGVSQKYRDLGSNAYAVAPARSASGKAMLVQNPHLPWHGEYLFTEMHLNKPGLNLYGSTLVGFPGIAIGFNEHLGWTHTNNTIDNADTYLLQLKDGGYLLDGERQEFIKTTKTIRVKDSTGKLNDQSIDIYKSRHGPLVKMGSGKALAIRMVGMDRPNIGYQWWKMATSKNFGEFETALKMAQIPFWNVMYADKQGNIFYLFNGLVPKRGEDSWRYWNRVIPGGKSADIWTEVHPYADLPKVKNPSQGWLQNANDPPWTSTLPMALKRTEYPGYMAPSFMHLRAQRSAGMLQDDPSITFEELAAYKLSTRLELADRILDDLFMAIDQYGTDIGKEAKEVLSRWDRQAESGSTGMLLFYEWATAMNPYNESMFAVKWDETKPRTTPDGLYNPKYAVQALEKVAAKIKATYGSLSVPWGDVYRINTIPQELPGNGADGSLGIFRVAWSRSDGGKKAIINGGDSWVGIIEFADIIRAKVLLSYGNSTQEGSPHNGDQLKLFSEKKLRDAHFYKRDVDTNRKRLEVFKNGKYLGDR